jgi:hypothetical protein
VIGALPARVELDGPGGPRIVRAIEQQQPDGGRVLGIQAEVDAAGLDARSEREALASPDRHFFAPACDPRADVR